MSKTTIRFHPQLGYLPKRQGSLIGAMVASLFKPKQRSAVAVANPEPGTIWTGPVTNASPAVPAETRIAQAGRRAMQATQPSRDALYESIKADALTDTEHSAFSQAVEIEPAAWQGLDRVVRVRRAVAEAHTLHGGRVSDRLLIDLAAKHNVAPTDILAQLGAETHEYERRQAGKAPADTEINPIAPNLLDRAHRVRRAADEARVLGLHLERTPEADRDRLLCVIAGKHNVAPLDIRAQLGIPNPDPFAPEVPDAASLRVPEGLHAVRVNVTGADAAAVRAACAAEMAKHPPGALLNTHDTRPKPVTAGLTACDACGRHSGSPWVALKRMPACDRSDIGPGCKAKEAEAAGYYTRTDAAIDDSATVAYAGYRRPGAIAAARAGLEDAGDVVIQSRVIARRVETDAECRARLLQEWEALQSRAPMLPGLVPGEPPLRTEPELIAQAQLLAGAAVALPWDLLFSLALTHCHRLRSPVYAEHDGNRLIRQMVKEAREIVATPEPTQPLPRIDSKWGD